MSQRRLLAFVSSRMAELAPERKIVKAELNKLHVDAWVFETDAGARAESVQQTYLKEVEAADFYIGIFWTGYGEYTIEEFDHAYKLGKSCLVYEKRSNIDSRDPLLTAFLQKIGEVKGLVTIKRFETPEELGGYIKQDVAAWQTEIVRKAAKPRGYDAPFQAPALGDKYVERTGILDQLKNTLLAQDDDGQPLVTRAALHGMGGSGKTNIATAFAHLDVVRKRFPDGVLYTTLGQNPDLKQRLSDWGHALHDSELPATGYIDPPSATSRLRTLLNNKACLLIVDDVWKGDHARAFVVGGSQCLLLITTRISEIGEEIEGLTIELAKMTPIEALRLVEKRSGPVADVDRMHADWLLQEVEYLPLALELISAQVKKLGWEDYRRRWNSQKLKAVKRGRESSGRYDNLWDSLELSVEQLSVKDQDRYFRLGVFQEDTSFPAGACARLWECGDDDAAEILVDFAGQALLHEHKEFRPRVYSFHDLLYEFVLDQLGEDRLKEANRTLIAGYRSLCNGEWHKLQDDGYVFNHLTEHLEAAGWADELYKLVSRDWMDVQFRRVHSHRAFAVDLGNVCALAQAETPPNLFQIIQATIVSATLGSLATRSDPEALAALAHIGEVDTALGHAELIQDPARKSRAYRLIAAALFGGGDNSTIQRVIQEALKAAKSINLPHVQCPVLCDLAETIFEAGDAELAQRVASDAESTARLERSDYWLPRLLIAVALAQDRVGNTEQSNAVALDALSIVEHDNQDQVVNQDHVLKMAQMLPLQALFENHGDSERAEQIKAKWDALFDEVNSKIKTDDDIYLGYAEELSAAFLKIGEAEDAAIIAERWLYKGWEAAGALARAGNALIQSGAIERGTQLVDASVDLVPQEIKIKDYQYRADTVMSNLGSVTEVLGRIGREHQALALANAAVNAEVKSHSLGTLALALAQQNAIDSARRAANASLAASQQFIQDSSQQASWLAAIAKALTKAGKKTEAIGFAKRAQSLVEEWEDVTWLKAARTMTALLETLSRLGENASALNLIDRMDYPEGNAEGWILMLRSPDTTSEERLDLGKRIVNVVADLAIASKPDVLGRTARALAEFGLGEEAIRLAELAISAIDKTEDRDRVATDTQCDAAHAFILSRRFDKARETIDLVRVHDNENSSRVMSLKVQALSALAIALGEAGQYEQALATTRVAQELISQDDSENNEANNFQSEALVEVGKTLAHLGKTDDARQANRRALELALDRLKYLGA